MTSRERWLSLLSNETPDRIPTDYWATTEVTQRLMRDLRCADLDALFNRLHIDIPDHILPIENFGSPSPDQWGITYRDMAYETGVYREPANHPMADFTSVEQIHNYSWPNPDDLDWDAFRARIKAASGQRIVRTGHYEPFLVHCFLRGMEQAMVDLIVEKEIAHAILDHIFDYCYAVNERAFDIGKGNIGLTYIAEDLGSQHGLLIGLDQIREFLLPKQKKMADLARSHGIHIFYHTDGAAREVIPDLIEFTGIEILNPIQWRCPGMEREGLVRDFGDKVIFHGAVDNQQTLAFGSQEDVRTEVLDNIRIFEKTRWICAPCHNIQAVSPTENIVAMYETIWENGKL